jgi:VWFA-related protein
VYAVAAVDGTVSASRQHRRALLEQIAETTGGVAFFPMSVRDLDAVYDRILEGIRAQYTLGYQSTNLQGDGAWRAIEVRLTRPDGGRLRLRSRAGYFAPYEPEP